MTKSGTTVTTKRAPNTLTKEEKNIRPSKKTPKVPAKNSFKAGKRINNSRPVAKKTAKIEILKSKI